MSVRTTDPETKIVTETFKGAVLAEYEENGYHDSYGWAIVWDAESATVKYEGTWSTAYYSTTGARVDATEESIMNAREYAFKILFKNKIKDHKIPTVGKRVKSLTTRGKAVGITGKIVRFEDDQYAPSWRSPRPKVAVIKVDGPVSNLHYGRNVYVKPNRLEVIDELTPEVENDYRQMAFLEAQEHDMRSLFHREFGLIYAQPKTYA
jgi:hypothetical protein